MKQSNATVRISGILLLLLLTACQKVAFAPNQLTSASVLEAANSSDELPAPNAANQPNQIILPTQSSTPVQVSTPAEVSETEQPSSSSGDSLSDYFCFTGQMTEAQETALLATSPYISRENNNGNLYFGKGGSHQLLIGSGNTIRIGGGSSVVEIEGDNNTIYSGSGTKVVFIKGNNNTYNNTGGGSNIYKFNGSGNTLNFGGGGCQSAYVLGGTVNVTDTGGTNSVNGEAARKKLYTSN